jgi:hypothetical protein
VIRGRSHGRRGAAPSLARALLACAVAVASAAACGPGPSVTAQPTIGPTPTASASEVLQSTSTAPAPSTGVAVDPSLLDLLPDAVAGHPLEESPEAAAESTGDALLARSAESIAVGIAADPATSSFAVASVVKLKPGVYDEEFFRDWRDSFDAGVCAQAGGVSGNAESEMAGRTVYIGTCAGGVHTYHVYLEGRDVIVSVNSVGEARLGEELMKDLPG